MKKIILLTVLATIFLTGCGGKGDDGNVTLNYYGRTNEKGFEAKIVSEFERENPGIKVNYVELPENTDQKLQTINTILQARDSSMDLFVGDVVWTPIFAGAGWALELDDYLSEEEIKAHTPGAMKAFQYMDKTYGLPFFTDGGMLYYREDLLEKYNKRVPETWSELVETAKEIIEEENDPNLYGFAGSWRQFEGLTTNLTELVWSHGGDFISEDGRVILDSKEAKEGMKTLVEMRNLHRITPPGITNFGSGDVRNLFVNGQLIFSRDWPTFNKMANDEELTDLAGKIKFALLPHGEGERSYSTLGGWGVMVSKFSKHPDEAVKFAKFRASKMVQKMEALELSHLPTLPELYEDEELLEAMPYIKDMLPIMMATKPRPQSPFYARVSAILQQQTQNALNEEKTPEKAVEDAAVQIKDVIGER